MPLFDLHHVKRQAEGRWMEILRAAGMPVESLDGRNHPCPKCGGTDRFAAFKDFSVRGAVHCRKCFTRGSEIAPCDGIATLRWWTGESFTASLQFVADQLGLLPRNEVPPPLGLGRHPNPSPFSGDLDQSVIEGHTRFAKDAYERIDRETRRWLAQWILVSESSLISLRVGLTSDRRCTTWPMRNESGEIIGVRISTLPWTEGESAKWSRRGSQSGIFVPKESPQGEPIPASESSLFICEGETDTAAATSLGLWAIGRAGATASTFFIERYIQRFKPVSVTVIADHDSPGQAGAKRLAKAISGNLPRSIPSVGVVQPPGLGMDLRDWIADGANQTDIRNSNPFATFQPTRQETFHFSETT